MIQHIDKKDKNKLTKIKDENLYKPFSCEVEIVFCFDLFMIF